MENTRIGNWIAGTQSGEGDEWQAAIDPTEQAPLPGKFISADTGEVDRAVELAAAAAPAYAKLSGEAKAIFLRAIADEIEALGDELIARAVAESGLPKGRITGERGRTCGQLRKFADHLAEGSWVEAIIDEAQPDRVPMPRADLRKMSVAIGPVVVFTASNFPLAFSTAGGDTAAALAAGCPVIVKAHPSHLGTNSLVSGAISKAAKDQGLPSGVFSSVQGDLSVGKQLVMHPKVKAIGFTGSFKGGRAIFDMANNRPEPIPVYAEMGSVNPIFLLSEKLAAEGASLADTIAGSVNLGVGQFCTNPGLIIFKKSETSEIFVEALREAFESFHGAPMLNEGIYDNYGKRRSYCTSAAGVNIEAKGTIEPSSWQGEATFARVSGSNFLKNAALQEEVFGPFTLLVECESAEEMKSVARALQGQLTGSIFGSPAELGESAELCQLLTEKVGRLIFNAVPTGVEVCAAMHHGGPYPAATFSGFTSVGVDAIKRFVRPVCYQNAPESLLPDALKPGNPLGIWRLVNGQRVRS